jgi:hypothetical protein
VSIIPGAPSAAPMNVFVAADGNGFMRDIASWIVEAAAATGRTAHLVDDRLPTPDGSLSLVVAPHEFFELFDAPTAELQRAAAASVCVCTEQPGTPWFHLSVDVCRRGLHSLDINPHGVDALRAVGVSATRLQLGAVPSVDVADDPRPRPIDVLFMGGLDDRRGAVLAELAPRLVHRRSELRLFRFDRPVTSHTPGLVFGAAKYELLASAAVLVNIHRDRAADHPPGQEPPSYFEWARLIEAMANGCVVVTEPAEGHEPLHPGIHFVTAAADELGDVVDALLDDPDRMRSIAEAAHHAVTVELDLAATLGPILDRLERDVIPRVAHHVHSSAPTRGLWRLGATRVPPPVRLGPFRPYHDLQVRAKRLALADSTMLQRLDATACLLRHGTEQHVERVETPTYADASPEVSVIVTLYNYADVVTETLHSIVASTDVAFEVIVVDDHATDASRDVVRTVLANNPDTPMVLLGKDVNEGLAAARNTGFAAARGEFVMVMDADNHVYPTCLRRLADTLRDDPAAAAAYAILEDFGDQRNVRSALAWDVERLCRANYIDAQAMWRRSHWEALGGYRADDEHVYGWEDWDLWLRLAASGGHATLRPEILGRYRVQRGSMIALTNLATDEAIAAIRRRHPALPWQPSG